MKITRTLPGGVEISVELTADEMQAAYLEQQHACDCDDVEDVLSTLFNEDKISAAELEAGLADLDMIANIKRDIFSEVSIPWEDAAREAICQFLNDKMR